MQDIISDYWKNFMEFYSNPNRGPGFEITKDMYLALNKYGNTENFEVIFNGIFKEFSNTDEVIKYLADGDYQENEKELDDFKDLVKIYLSEFTMSLHTPNQIKADLDLSVELKKEKSEQLLPLFISEFGNEKKCFYNFGTFSRTSRNRSICSSRLSQYF